MYYVKLKNIIITAVGAIFFAPTIVSAQTNPFMAEYEAFRKAAQANYEDFRSKCNAEYAEFVRKAWKEYKSLPSLAWPKDETVPPVVIQDKDKARPIRDNQVTIENVVTPIIKENQPKPVAPIRENKDAEERQFAFSYMGTACHVRVPEDLNLHVQGYSNESVAEAWNTLATDKMDNTIRDFLILRLQMRLCDWAYLNIIDAFSKAFYGDSNEAELMTAFIYSQSGYMMRLARSGSKLYMLYGTKHYIYDKEYFLIGDVNFYKLGADVDKLEMCDYAFPQEQTLSLYIPQTPKFACQPSQQRELAAARPGMEMTVEVNKNLIDFYNTYPSSCVEKNFMTRWAMYANTPMQEEIRKTLYPAIKSKIAGLDKVEAADRILNWVQTALVYEYDDKVWGHDRAFFAEETLYYPYCDCEDRSILYTRLVRDILGLKCILVFYPGHLASAVCFDEAVRGDYIQYGGSRYTICDATYIGAPLGLTMPGMDNASATVILLE